MKRIGSSWEDLRELTNENYIVTSNVSTGVYVHMDIRLEA